MKEIKMHAVYDSVIMFKRCLCISLRNPEAILMATITPFFLMLLFGTIFGNIADVGTFNYIDFIVPGIILQSIGNASQHTAMNVASDMTKGIIERFQSMSIAKSAVLIGHIGAGGIRNTVTTVIIICTALLLGFRPRGGFNQWLIVIGILIFANITISTVAVLCGLLAKSVEGASGFMFPLFILPFISSGFAPIETMPVGIKWFAEIQPMTPMIDCIRALFLDLPIGNSLWLTLLWCGGIIIVSFLFSLRVYKNKRV